MPEQRLRFDVSPELPFFAGHFPGAPVLPGVAQLSAFVLPASRERWPELGRLLRVWRVKFMQPVLPGAKLELELERPPARPDTVYFKLYLDSEMVSQGRMKFAVAHEDGPGGP